jgi:hypothetical protein
MIAPCSVNANGSAPENLSLPEVVAICDHLLFLFHLQPEHEIVRKTVPVAFHLFVEPLRGHSVQLGQVRVEHDLVSSNEQNARFDSFRWDDRLCFGFHGLKWRQARSLPACFLSGWSQFATTSRAPRSRADRALSRARARWEYSL